VPRPFLSKLFNFHFWGPEKIFFSILFFCYIFRFRTTNTVIFYRACPSPLRGCHALFLSKLFNFHFWGPEKIFFSIFFFCYIFRFWTTNTVIFYRTCHSPIRGGHALFLSKLFNFNFWGPEKIYFSIFFLLLHFSF
jgi:hypothetical protein